MQIFARGTPFDYGLTLSDATDMPINIGIQFVPRGRYGSAIAFLQDVLAIYPFNSTFTAGQVCSLVPGPQDVNTPSLNLGACASTAYTLALPCVFLLGTSQQQVQGIGPSYSRHQRASQMHSFWCYWTINNHSV